jgi:hypothetical protein
MNYLVSRLQGATNVVSFYLWLAVVATYHSVHSYKTLAINLLGLFSWALVCEVCGWSFWTTYAWGLGLGYSALLAVVILLYRKGGMEGLRTVYVAAYTPTPTISLPTLNAERTLREVCAANKFTTSIIYRDGRYMEVDEEGNEII